MDFIQITLQNRDLLDTFLKNDLSDHFRYYRTRNVDDCIRSHTYTVIGTLEGQPIAYGHLEYEKTYWLGVCVLNEFQGKGYGRAMVKHLIVMAKMKRLPKIELTVDIDNLKAINLYKQVGFIQSPLKYEHCIRMIYRLDNIHRDKDNSVTVPVSYGEAIDKLAILEIKFTKMETYKKEEVQKEYNEVLGYVTHLMNDDAVFYYNHLVSCSTIIWNQQVDFRNNLPGTNRPQLCDEIIFENDRRYRLKNKLNNLLGSFLMEQKEGYAVKKAFVLTHLGLGDLICANGMVRYLATTNDLVMVVVKDKYLKEAELIYSDDKTIKFYPVKDDINISPRCGFGIDKFNQITQGYDVYMTGVHKGSAPTEIPFSFYTDAKMKTEYFWDFFHIPSTLQSMELYNLVKGREYVVIHNVNSRGNVFTVDSVEKHIADATGKTRDQVLIIDLNGNVYDKEHPSYELAQKFVFRSIVSYKDILIHASRLYLSDSCIFCMAINLELECNKCYYITRKNNPRNYSYFYEKYRPDPRLHRRTFERLEL